MTAIGGYFELDRGGGSGFPHLEKCVGFQSARSALRAVLRAAGADTVWAPNFVCGAVDDVLAQSGANIMRYAISPDMGVPADLDVGALDLVIAVDFFGLTGEPVARAIRQYGVSRVIVDAAQSLFFPIADGATTIFSPRKFVGVPDGGLVATPFALAPVAPGSEEESMRRCRHLLIRLAGDVEHGYAEFQKDEASFGGVELVSMTNLTRALLARVDSEFVRDRRIRNYTVLQELLGDRFEMPELKAGYVPLTCPVSCRDAVALRRRLIEQRIYTPVYWSDATIPPGDTTALRLRDRTVYLPCDQRYGEDDMQRTARAFLDGDTS